MKNEKNITETVHGKGVYVMEVKKGSVAIKGNSNTERLQNAIREFFKPTEKRRQSISK